MSKSKLSDETRKRIELLGYYIREHRYEAGLTQQEVAEELGIDRSTLTAIENSKTNYGINHIVRLSNYYNVSVSQLMSILE